MTNIETSPPEPIAERRAPRERLMMNAQLSWGDGAFGVEAVVTQISATGARLQLPGEPNLPSEISVEIPRRSVLRRARVVKRQGSGVTVAFLGADAAAAAAVDGAKAHEKIRLLNGEITRLKLENARLRAELVAVHGGGFEAD